MSANHGWRNHPGKMKITYSNGTPSDTANTTEEALEIIAAAKGVDAADLITDDSGDRTLVWLSEEDAENDDGAKAVAQITE